jgi:Flp pilus assembly protein CpaB
MPLRLSTDSHDPPIGRPAALASIPTTGSEKMVRTTPGRANSRLLTTLRTPGWRRALLLRRAAALLLALLALALALRPPAAAARSPVVVAARDLPSGTALGPADLALATWPGELVPAGALRAAAEADGRVLAGAARAGEPITDVRLAGPDAAGRLAGRPGDAAVPIRLADPEVARLLGPGSRVDVVTPAPDGDRPAVLAADAAVLTVVATDGDTPVGPGPAARGRLVLVALPRADAARVAAAALSEAVAVTLR